MAATSKSVYSYDNDPPPQYQPLQSTPGPQMGYGTLPPSAPPVYITTQPMPTQTTQVIIVGGCPACRIGVLEDDYTALGVLCAVLFFPIGILCCLALKQRRCSNCHAIFG